MPFMSLANLFNEVCICLSIFCSLAIEVSTNCLLASIDVSKVSETLLIASASGLVERNNAIS